MYNLQKIYFSVIMIIISFIITIFLSKKYKLKKEQMLIFWLLVLFWTSISIIRAYRKVYATEQIALGGLGLSALLAAKITSAYGLVSCIIRLPLFFASDILKKRKIFIQIASVIVIITSISTVYFKTYNALYFSSVAMGICASMLAIFNVMFSETFKSESASVSASILSVAPLLAEFIAAPIQYLGTHGEYKNYALLWISSSILALLSLILSFFMKELKMEKRNFSIEKVKYVLKNRRFIVICIVSIVVSFIKFSTSGANMIYYSKQYLAMNSFMLAYIDTIFSSSQLVASVLVGTYFKNKYGIEKTLFLSLLCLLSYYLILIFTNNAYITFFFYVLNGFGYGGTYISLISIALQYFDKDYRDISMGIFQGFFAFGIFFGDRIYVILAKSLNGNPKLIFLIVSIVTFVSLLLVGFKVLKRRTF